jgi:Domain of unknown function (DUF4123)
MLPGLPPIESTARVCLVDAARVHGLAARLEEQGAEAQSLYAGPAGDELADVAPWIVTLEPGSPFAKWFFGSAWGQSAGVVVAADADPDELRTHFRRFLTVMDETGKSLYFRFYDPRVLRIFLPTCDAEQLLAFFGPITAFVAEDEDAGRALRFTLAGGDLVTESIDLNDAPPTPTPRARIAWKKGG